MSSSALINKEISLGSKGVQFAVHGIRNGGKKHGMRFEMKDGSKIRQEMIQDELGTHDMDKILHTSLQLQRGS